MKNACLFNNWANQQRRLDAQAGDEKRTTLYHAGRKENYIAYKMLTSAGADETINDAYGRKATDYFKAPKMPEIKEYYTLGTMVRTSMVTRGNPSFSSGTFAAGTPIIYDSRTGIYRDARTKNDFESCDIVTSNERIMAAFNSLKQQKIIQLFQSEQLAINYARSLSTSVGPNCDSYFAPLVFKVNVKTSEPDLVPAQCILRDAEFEIRSPGAYLRDYQNRTHSVCTYFQLETEKTNQFELIETILVRGDKKESIPPYEKTTNESDGYTFDPNDKNLTEMQRLMLDSLKFSEDFSSFFTSGSQFKERLKIMIRTYLIRG